MVRSASCALTRVSGFRPLPSVVGTLDSILAAVLRASAPRCDPSRIPVRCREAVCARLLTELGATVLLGLLGVLC